MVQEEGTTTLDALERRVVDRRTSSILPPVRIGAFAIEGVLGKGGMGVVYRAVGDGDRPIALKVIDRHAPTEAVERFRREARVRIDHDNVVKLLAAGETEGKLYIAFELLEGRSLAARMKDSDLTPEEVVDLGVQVCRGLQAAHEAGLVHRDIKPSNLFICDDGTVKILDFGIARREVSEVELTTTGAVIGTPSYLAPEQARGRHRPDVRTDVWGLATVLYQALAGQPPFRRDSSIATMFAIITEPLPALARNASVPVELAAIIERALAKDLDGRWPDAAAFGRALAGADLSGAPARAESLRPDEHRVVAVLLADGVIHLRSLKESIRAKNGEPIEMLGRQLIGLFGGRTWEGDEILRAAELALETQHLADRVVIASGRAKVSDGRVEGRAFEAAERALAHAEDAVVVDAQTARSLRSRYHLEPLGDHFAIGAPLTPKETADLSTEQAELTFGRAAERLQMEAAARSAVGEQRLVTIAVTGPVGSGKSVLKPTMQNAFKKACLDDDRDGIVLDGRAESHKTEEALSLFVSMLETRANQRTAFDGAPSIAPDRPLSERQEAVEELVLEALPDAVEAIGCAPFIGVVLGVEMPEDDRLSAALDDPRLMADQLRLAILDYVEGLTAQRPVALMLEDLHWADEESLGVLEELCERLEDTSTLLFVTTREPTPKLPGAIVLGLRGLPKRDVAKLAAITAGRPLADAMIEAIFERTSGNPMFVEQIVRELAARDALDEATPKLPLPVSVEAAVQSRLDRLSKEEKTLLKQASVFRRPFFVEELRGLGHEDPEPMLEALRDAEILQRSRSRDRTRRRYRFRSELLEDVTYRMLTSQRRKALHTIAGGFLLAHERPPQEIAWHFEHGTEPAKAAPHYLEAAKVAHARADMRSVLRFGNKALAGTVERFELLMLLADAHQFLGDRDKMIERVREALDQAKTSGERARALAEVAWWELRTGDARLATVTAAEAVDEARLAEAPDVLCVALGRIAMATIAVGEHDIADKALDEALGIAKSLMSPRLEGLVCGWRAHLATSAGDLGERAAAFRDAVERYTLVGDVRRAVGADVNLADTYNRTGEFELAEAALESALERCQRIGHRLMEGYANLNLAYARIEMGKKLEALEALDHAARIADATNEARLTVFERIYRARARIGEPGCAVDAEQVALEAEQRQLPGPRALALTVAARAHLEDRRPDEALACSRAALSLRDDLGSLEEGEADIFITHAEALTSCGQTSKATGVLERGRERIKELGSKITDRDVRQTFFYGVDSRRRLLGIHARPPVTFKKPD